MRSRVHSTAQPDTVLPASRLANESEHATSNPGKRGRATKCAPTLGRQERAVKHDQVIFGQFDVECGAILDQTLSAYHRDRGDRRGPEADAQNIRVLRSADNSSRCRPSHLAVTAALDDPDRFRRSRDKISGSTGISDGGLITSRIWWWARCVQKA